MAFLEIKNLTYGHIKGPVVVNDFSCSENNGTIFLFGEKLAGKTTLLEVLCGMNDLFYGKVKIEGKDITQATDSISYLPSDPVLIARKTVEYNLKFASEVCKKDYKFLIDSNDWIKQNLNKKINKLSFYEKQMLCLYRAKIKDAKLLLIDLNLENKDENDIDLYIEELKKMLFAKNKLIIVACSPKTYLKLQNDNKNCRIWYQNSSKIEKFANIDDYNHRILYAGMIDYLNKKCTKASIIDSANGYLFQVDGLTFKLREKWVKNICEYFSVSNQTEVLIYSECSIADMSDEQFEACLENDEVMLFDAITLQRLK